MEKSEQVIIVPISNHLLLTGLTNTIKKHTGTSNLVTKNLVNDYLTRLIKGLSELPAEDIFYNGRLNNWSNKELFKCLNRANLLERGRPGRLTTDVGFLEDVGEYAYGIVKEVLEKVPVFGDQFEMEDMYVIGHTDRLKTGRISHYLTITYVKVMEYGTSSRLSKAYIEAKPYIRSIVFGVLFAVGPIKLIRLVKLARSIKSVVTIIENSIVEAEVDLKDKDATDILKDILAAGLEAKVKEYVSRGIK